MKKITEQEIIDVLDNIELENISKEHCEQLIDCDNTISDRLDHEMSGYNDSFNVMDITLHLTKISETKFKVKVIMDEFGGNLPGYYQRQLDSGEMDWEQVVEDYDDLRSFGDGESTFTKTFKTLKEAILFIDNQLGPYEG